jgi:transcriptional regulator with XRE-family HTH domain
VSQVGARILFLRFERGLSLQKLAAKTRYSINKVRQVELGQLILTAGMLRRFARALRVQPFDLLNFDTQFDDLGCLVEIMRQDRKMVRVVRKRIQRAQSALHTCSRVQVND